MSSRPYAALLVLVSVLGTSRQHHSDRMKPTRTLVFPATHMVDRPTSRPVGVPESRRSTLSRLT